MQKISALRAAWLCGVLLSAMPLPALAADVFKANNTDNLNLGSSWIGGAAPGVADVGVWESTITNTGTVLLGADSSWAGIRVANPAGLVTIGAGNALTLGGSGIDLSAATVGLTLGNAVSLGAAQTWNVAAGQVLTASGTISGGNSLTKLGEGTLILGGTNTYTGGTTNRGGIVQLNAAAGAGTGPITFKGGILAFNPSAGMTAANPWNIAADTTNMLVVTSGSGGNPISSGAWSGGGTILISNTYSPFTVNGTMDAFTGTILLVTPNGAQFRFNSGGGNTSFGSTNATFDLGNGNGVLIARNAGTMNLGALQGGPSTSLLGQGSGSGTLNWSIGAKNLNTTFAGTIANSTSSRIAAITKVGTATLTLSGANTYTGATTVNGGTLQIGDGGTSGTLGTGSVVNNASLAFNRSDSLNVANSISGSGTIVQQGTGSLIIDGAVNCAITVNAGTLAVGAGSIAAPVSVAAGASFDISTAPSYVLGSALAGNGSINGLLVAGTGANIRSGGVGTAGTLTFGNGLSLSGGAILAFDLSDDPAGTTKTNDLIVVTGDLTLNGANSILANPLNSKITPGTYKLIRYTGNLVGSLANLTVGSPFYTLINPPGEIDLVVASTRPAANLVWVGNSSINNWDEGLSTNWVSGGSLSSFLSLDAVQFDQTGAGNPIVNLVGVLAPKAVVVDATGNYVFAGSGGVSGTGGLTKTNTGTLTVLTLNDYSGPTIIGGGTLVVSNLSVGVVPSGIGAANPDPTNLVFYGSTLRYVGASASTDRGAQLNNAGVTVEVTDAAATLTMSGTLAGLGGLTKMGAGQLDLGGVNSFSGGTAINEGTVRLAAANAFGTNVVALNGNNTGATLLFGADTQTLPNLLTIAGTNNFVVNRGNNTLGRFAGGGTVTVNQGSSGNTITLGGDSTGFTGTLVAGTITYLRFYGSLGSSVATFDTGVNTATINNRNGNVNIQLGALKGGVGTTLAGATSTANPSTYTIGGNNLNTLFEGAIVNGTGSGSPPTAIIKTGSGTLTLSGASTYTGATTVSNGVLALTGSASLGSTNITVNAGAILDVSGLTANWALASGQTLQGDGTVLGSVELSGGGEISPGNPLGTLTITNQVNLAGGITRMELNRDNPTTTNDLILAKSIAFGGSLVVTNTGPSLHVGDTFKLFSGTLSGSFATLELPATDANLMSYTWRTENLAVDGTIQVLTATSSVNRTPTNLVSTFDGSTLTLSWPDDYRGWQLQAQTNAPAVGLGTNWVAVPGSELLNSIVVPIDPANGAVFFRLALPGGN